MGFSYSVGKMLARVLKEQRLPLQAFFRQNMMPKCRNQKKMVGKFVEIAKTMEQETITDVRKSKTLAEDLRRVYSAG
jgi:antitoxin component of RelBE/YafQ-DinJ toxin-antitoxin module